ncbi:MAG: hypothetical protein H0X17_10960 [Deltaproteobacteria bacterium]|nr:hypothetical protein [Deltaproteobacteria bacterium]
MSDRPDIDALRELGENTTNVANAWAGADDYLSQGLLVWTRRTIEDDRKHAVRAALAVCKLVAGTYPIGNEAQAPKQYIDTMLASIQRWVENPSHSNHESVRSALDVTRQVHAWQAPDHIPHFWTLEAVDHACLAVWSGERSSYIVPMDFATCAARSVTCVFHVLTSSGQSEADAIQAVVDAVVGAAA